MTDEEFKKLLILCQMLALEGLNNGTFAIIPGLKIDKINPHNFLGLNNNPAIFVTQLTYDKLKRFHEDWLPNRTIAIKQEYIIDESRKMIDIIGVIVHEAGHAFNVYAGLPNTETNAYIFEIEILRNLYKKNILREQFGITQEDIVDYYNSRMDQYNHGRSTCPYLKNLISDIENHKDLQNSNNDSSFKVNQSRDHARLQMGLSFFSRILKKTPELSNDHSKSAFVSLSSTCG